MAQNPNHPFHVPQQNRRNKLRENPPTMSPFQQPLMNPSLSPTFFSLQTLKDLNYLQPSSSYSQGLSLSLSFQLDSQRSHNSNGEITEMRSSVPLGPFTGYASILKSSRFLKPAQQILEDMCGVNCGRLEFSLDCLSEGEVMREVVGLSDRVEFSWKNSKLMLMLDELYRKYKLYCQQMQSVVASFDTVAGLGNAAPYISFAIKFVLNHFTCLNHALLDQIQASDNGNVSKGKYQKTWNSEQVLQCQNPTLLKSNYLQLPVWRSQRGLPDHAVAVLKTWLFEHFLHPYPTDSEKQILAQQTGLSRNQVSNWFINARVRLWKPMVEEIHMLESQQAEMPTKRSRTENSETSFRNLSSNYHNPGVSLALSLPNQNKETNLPWPMPIEYIANHVNPEMISFVDSAMAGGGRAENQED